MHLFLYKAARHSTSGYNNRYRFKQNTKRGDFDLELLKRGIKGRFEIICHGDHPFQKALDQIDMSEEFYGHVVAIEEAKNAIWFKLNYDQVGKKQTTYVGGWRDLSDADILPFVEEYRKLKTENSALMASLNATKYQTRNVQDFVSRNAASLANDEAFCIVKEKSDEYIQSLIEVNLVVQKRAESVIAKMAAMQNKVRSYMVEKKL